MKRAATPNQFRRTDVAAAYDLKVARWMRSSAFILAIGLIAAGAWLAIFNLSRGAATAEFSQRIRTSLLASEILLSTLKDAETGQRGYLLTGDAAYLEPYETAQRRLDADLNALAQTPLSNESQVAAIRRLTAAKMAELAKTISLSRAGHREAALEMVQSNDGKRIMDSIRQEVDRWQAETQAELVRVQSQMPPIWEWVLIAAIVTVAVILLGYVALVHRRMRRALALSIIDLERFVQAFGQSHGMLRTEDGRITFWAEGMEQFYGYTPGEAVGRISHELLAAQFPLPLPEIERVLSESGYWQGELIHRHKNGARLVVASHWALHRGGGNESGIVIEINNDITQQKQIEAALRDNEISLRVALDASELGFWHFSKTSNLRKTTWDDRCRAIFGLGRGQAIDRDLWLSMVHPEDREKAQVGPLRASDPAEPRDDYASEYRVVRPDGRIVLVEITGRALFELDTDAPSGRRVRNTLGTMRDVTEIRGAERQERERANALLQAIIGTAPGLIYAKGLDGGLLVANQPVLDLIGKPWSEVRGLTDREYLENPAEAVTIMANDRRIMEHGSVEEIEEFVGTIEGAPRVWLSTKTPMRDADGQVIGLVGVSIEITERKRSEERLQTLVHELNHRVKNTLATVQAIAMQTLRRADPVLRAALDARLMALATAHDVLTRESWQGANLTDVVTTALAPFRTREGERFTISGPALRLRPHAALSLSMALHELATNALKYGALSISTGRVALVWTVEKLPAVRFRLTWTESGVRDVKKPERRGFGSRLIEQVVAQDLSARTSLDFNATGVVCTIDAPASEVIPDGEIIEFPRVGRMGAA